MSISARLPQPQIVDNLPRHYTREQARNGGILRGAAQRFQARDRHAEVRRLRTLGYSLRRIAAIVGNHFTTVSRILSGKIRTCLTRSETLAAKVLRQLTPPLPNRTQSAGDVDTNPSQSESSLLTVAHSASRPSDSRQRMRQAIVSTPKRRRRFDPFGGGIPKLGDPRYAGFLAGVRLYDSTHAGSIPKCECGAEIVRRSQVCPVCGRDHVGGVNYVH